MLCVFSTDVVCVAQRKQSTDVQPVLHTPAGEISLFFPKEIKLELNIYQFKI